MDENKDNKGLATKLILIGLVILVALGGLYFLSGRMGNQEEVEMGGEEMTTEEPPEETAMEEEIPEEVVEEPTSDQTITEILGNTDYLSVLASAVEQAELNETLSGEGPYTVFAPSNLAFQQLPEATLDEALSDQELLTEILTYHVVSDELMSGEIVEMQGATTVQGSDLTFEVMEGNVMVNDSTVVTADIEASNGVIHVIDTVLLPE